MNDVTDPTDNNAKYAHWQRALDERAANGLLRELTAADVLAEEPRWVMRNERRLLNLASNDYLGLSHHPHLKQAACDAIERLGTGTGASRLVSGHSTLHAEIEARFAAFKHAEAALICPTGYQANLAAVTALAGPGDLVCIDKLTHASLIDAARASGATVRVYPHLNLAKLERLLSRNETLERNSSDRSPTGDQAGTPSRDPLRFIITDSIFSMDGDAADLPALCDLAAHHEALLIVDEAHGTGVLGTCGAGLCEAQGVTDRVDLVVSTASKALGGLGGIITGNRVLIDTIINHARAFIYTTAASPAQVAAIGAALDVIHSEPWRRERVIDLSRQVKLQLARLGFESKSDSSPAASGEIITPIIPLVTGSVESALALQQHLESHGILAPAIRPPTVAPGAARVRLSLRADITDAEVASLVEALSTRKQ